MELHKLDDLGGREVDDKERLALENRMCHIAKLIQDGAQAFLKQEYTFVAGFVILFALVIVFTVERQLGEFWSTVPFLVGAATSLLSGYIGMQVAVRANVRTAKMATDSLNEAFNVAFRGGMVLGFILVGLALCNLLLLIWWYRSSFLDDSTTESRQQQTLQMTEALAGYGLGGSTVALFGRVGGGIYTKAADVGADLVGKVVHDLPEDSIRNPAVVADNVGDNVGDIAGMGSDLFGSFAESTCACLVISATSPELVDSDALLFPLMISAAGIVVGILVSFVSTHFYEIESTENVETSLKIQLIASTFLMSPILYALAMNCLPANFTFPEAAEGGNVTNLYAFICALVGLWSGLIIGLITEYYTSGSYQPV